MRAEGGTTRQQVNCRKREWLEQQIKAATWRKQKDIPTAGQFVV